MNTRVPAKKKQDYLVHHGILGMKWGVRRYQNKDGTLTAAGQKRYAKELQKDYNKNRDSSHPFKTSEAYKQKAGQLIDKHITDNDKKRVATALDKFRQTAADSAKAEHELDELAQKYAKKYYDEEVKKHPDSYQTERAQIRLFEYCEVELGFDQAKKERPDLVETINTHNKAYKDYTEECKKVCDNILGDYGNTKLTECKYYSFSIRDSFGDIVENKSANGWRT